MDAIDFGDTWITKVGATCLTEKSVNDKSLRCPSLMKINLRAWLSRARFTHFKLLTKVITMASGSDQILKMAPPEKPHVVRGSAETNP